MKRLRSCAGLSALVLAFGCGKPEPKTARAEAMAFPPGSGPAFTDYIAFERAKKRLWVPMARDIGSVDVFELGESKGPAGGRVTRIDGFPTAEREHKGKKRTVGPSSIAIGEGFVYVGNRASDEICAIEGEKLTKGDCYKVPRAIDGIAYVASQKELWVTSPHDKTLVVLDASTPAKLSVKLDIELEGEPEGFSVDEGRGIFYTNLEDKDRTLAIDVKTHKVTSTWSPECGAEGPRGLAIDEVRQLLVVACTDRLHVLRDGKVVSELVAGSGIDNVDWLASKRWIFAAAAKSGRLSIARLEDDGKLVQIASVPIGERVRNAVSDEVGNAYAVDPVGARLVVVRAP